MKLISCINELRSLKNCTQCNILQLDQGLFEIIHTRLRYLKQEIRISIGEEMGPIDYQRITLTAEFYRVASLLYLCELAPSQATPEKAVHGLVRDSLLLIEQMGVCTSPWPLFILACNVTSDEERLKLLAILNNMNEKRRIGNYQTIKGLIQAFWKQQDLAMDEKAPKQIDWRGLLDPNSCVPSFI